MDDLYGCFDGWCFRGNVGAIEMADCAVIAMMVITCLGPIVLSAR